MATSHKSGRPRCFTTCRLIWDSDIGLHHRGVAKHETRRLASWMAGAVYQSDQNSVSVSRMVGTGQLSQLGKMKTGVKHV
ncbi:hypothetical protein RRG08_053921 [Elysia crispata]|uniref:Uncharacterized protein n=1 Tax=Elysia crispata TaxID=231223 RepID=A0AAE1ANV8_9GAST|nr:hypothetical protein RRG08_053921 [Elysia crispata]